MDIGVVGTGGVVVAAAMLVRQLTLLVVVVWSMRADEEGRKHAIQIINVLRLWRQKPP